MRWFVVQTDPSGEAKAQRNLTEKGFTSYLPQETRWKRTKVSRERVNRPLMTGYMFVGISDGQAHAEVRSLDGIRAFVCVSGVPYEIPAQAVQSLRERELSGEFDYTPARKSIFRKGRRAKVLSGPFKGHIGEMLQAEDGRIRLMLNGLFAGKLWLEDDRLEAA